MRNICKIEDCGRFVRSDGLCQKHNARLRRWGDPLALGRNPVGPMDRMRKRIDVTGFCWLWNASLMPSGYAQIKSQGKNVQAHRWVYETLVGPIPDGLELDHLCRVRHCVNPDHLEPVTRSVNVLRAIPYRKKPPISLGCIRGHSWTIDELPSARSGRRCRLCHNEDQRARKRRLRAEAKAT